MVKKKQKNVGTIRSFQPKSRKCVIPVVCVCETRRRYVVKHNLITEVYLMSNYVYVEISTPRARAHAYS